MLFDHGLVAALSLFAFWLLLVERDGGSGSLGSAVVLLVAGVLGGLAVVMNYSSVITVSFLTLYAVWVVRSWRKMGWFLVGLVLPLIFLAWYHATCFGSPWANANTYQYNLFQDEEMMIFGMFGVPRFELIWKLLFSDYRGLFFTCPVLVLSCLGLWQMAMRRGMRAEAALFVAIFAGFLVMNSAVNHWHSGWSIGPRYLIPAIPFLSLPLTLVFERLPRLTLAVASISGAILLLVTAVDPQPYVGIGSPLKDYILPLVQGGEVALKIAQTNNTPPVVRGEVSANPIGFYESWFYPVFHPEIVQRQWNSFNLGEFIWAGSLISLLPLCCVLVLGLGALGYWSRQSVTDAPEPPMSTR